jgi:hypothetical protein
MTVKDKAIVLPGTIEFQVSQDNKEYISVAVLKNEPKDDFINSRLQNFSTAVKALKARYVRVIIKTDSTTARDPRLMIDEVVVK